MRPSRFEFYLEETSGTHAEVQRQWLDQGSNGEKETQTASGKQPQLEEMMMMMMNGEEEYHMSFEIAKLPIRFQHSIIEAAPQVSRGSTSRVIIMIYK